ncbi:SPFH domain-containing protein [Enterococcus timonensis]|uniref:SPFH domain-containing protein n=1 Tax=Enterococcus timonensis TaxID=1852364 RepID=UPI0008DA5010|nr:SPFH domain-containing protein [Enterococcus timonensis]
MGLLKAATSTIGGALADQWLDVVEPNDMGQQTVVTTGIKVRQNDKRGSNRKGTEDVVTDGSVIHVYPNTMMLLVDGGKIIDFTAEEGYYTVKNDAAPSLFKGNFKGAIEESFERFKFGGVTPQKQKVYFINLQEIKGIRFGTSSPLNYFDNFYNAELFLRAHGNYSIRITDPILFFKEAIPRNTDRVEIDDINEQYLAEFLTALQSAINQLSQDGQRISYVPSKSVELSKYMAEVLDAEWKQNRGMEVASVAVSSISYTDDSQKLINMRNQGAMLGDANVREGYVQGAMARGMEEAGKNPGGAASGFFGVGMGMNQAGNYFSDASRQNAQQAQDQAQKQAQNQNQNQGAGANTNANADGQWTCPKCGTVNTGRFCSNCGTEKPAPVAENTSSKIEMKCQACGEVVDLSNGVPKFCPHCGKPFVGAPL